MSADLFAEFGYSSPSTRPSTVSHQQRSGTQAGSLIPDLDVFEEATSTFSPQNNIDDQQYVSHSVQPQISSGQSAFALSTNSSQFQSYEDGSNVLFDATLETVSDNESEDWGEFESAEPTSGQRQMVTCAQQPAKTQGTQRKSSGLAAPLNLMDSLSIEDSIPPTSGQPTVTRRTDKPGPQTKSSAPDPIASILAHEEPFEEWGEFIDGPPEEPVSAVASRASGKGTPDSKTKPAPTAVVSSPTFNERRDSVPESQIRPTNIPPPSVLLELFPSLFEELRQEATNAKRDLQQRDTVETVASLVFCTLKTAARVVAGRTLRWKRDNILSQSMRIGPARSGKAGGMKLNTVNKNESIKEQQEAVDVITMWRDYTALFNSVIQASGRRPIQVITENARVVTATSTQGAIKASHACALCGLKRDERLPKVDENVEDSFGEWWVEHWGHTECKEFWGRNMSLLAQR